MFALIPILEYELVSRTPVAMDVLRACLLAFPEQCILNPEMFPLPTCLGVCYNTRL